MEVYTPDITKREGCIFYFSWLDRAFDIKEHEGAEEAFMLLAAIIEYARSQTYDNTIGLSRVSEMVFDMARPQLDSDIRKYLDTCIKNRKNRLSSGHQLSQVDSPVVTSGHQLSPDVTDGTDKDKDYDYDKGKEREKGKEKDSKEGEKPIPPELETVSPKPSAPKEQNIIIGDSVSEKAQRAISAIRNAQRG